jgi:LPXTG-site transpeptidase (sortase) family protein
MAIGRALLIFILATFTLFHPKQVTPAGEKVEIIKNDIYALELPRLGINEEITDGVDPFKMSSYMPAIVDNIAQAGGTDENLIYLFAHSSNFRYKNTVSEAIFANLYETKINDPVIINRYGNIKKFRVTKIETVAATNLAPLKQSPETETLVLQTCWPPTNLQTRLIVTAKPAVDLAGNLRPLEDKPGN